MIDFFNNNYSGKNASSKLHKTSFIQALWFYKNLIVDSLRKTTSFCLVIRRVKKFKGNSNQKSLSEGCFHPPQCTGDFHWDQCVVLLSCGGKIGPWGKQ